MNGVGLIGVTLLAVACAPPAHAQEDHRIFVGGLVGVSTLQADGRAVTTASDAALSLYKPENGLALNVFTGFHVASYFSIQANWMWNRNDITLVSSVSSVAAPQSAAFYEQQRQSHQSVFDVDGLIYFRRLDATVRPYLGTGLAVLRFTSDRIVHSSVHGLEPPERIASTRVGLRSHVGIDVTMSRHLRFRYSFSETISTNPISPALTPPGERRLANFQNLFGIVGEF